MFLTRKKVQERVAKFGVASDKETKIKHENFLEYYPITGEFEGNVILS